MDLIFGLEILGLFKIPARLMKLQKSPSEMRKRELLVPCLNPEGIQISSALLSSDPAGVNATGSKAHPTQFSGTSRNALVPDHSIESLQDSIFAS